MSESNTKLNSELGGIASYKESIKKKKNVIATLIILVFFLGLVSVNAGAAKMNPWKVFKTIVGFTDEKASIVIWRIRMPRVITAIVAGAGLSVSGCVMQNNLKNPLASPSTLGVSSAATFGANLAIIFFGAGSGMTSSGSRLNISSPYLVTVSAFVFAMGAVMVILSLAKLKSFSSQAIILAGVALSSIFGAGTTLLQYLATDEQVASAVFWTFGDLGRVSWREVGIISVVVILSSFYFYFKKWDYNALVNGEETAKSLGVNTDRTRFWGLLVSSLITAVIVSFVGMIGFIGLIGPQIMNRIVGSDYRFLIPSSTILGAVILLLADTAARTVVSPIILPVGVITSLLGGPMFLYLLMRGDKK